jgi:hypothetical protein
MYPKAAKRILLTALALAGYSCTGPDAVTQEVGGATLRDVFLGVEDSPLNETVGRLGIVLVRAGRYEQVGLRHIFTTGDQFRFDITSNRDGWLYILHTDPGGTLSQLWPPPGGPAQEIRAGNSYLIPASPNVFVFSDDTGDESFLVAIRPDPVPPDLGSGQVAAQRPAETLTADAAGPGNRIVNFDVRDPFGGASAAVVFEPPAGDADTYLYFSPLPDDATASAGIAFQLRHDR